MDSLKTKRVKLTKKMIIVISWIFPNFIKKLKKKFLGILKNIGHTKLAITKFGYTEKWENFKG